MGQSGITLDKETFNAKWDDLFGIKERRKRNAAGDDPKGHILAISSDYPYAKLFEPEMTLKQLKKSLNKRRRAA